MLFDFTLRLYLLYADMLATRVTTEGAQVVEKDSYSV